jgi:hypothetical protein
MTADDCLHGWPIRQRCKQFVTVRQLEHGIDVGATGG